MFENAAVYRTRDVERDPTLTIDHEGLGRSGHGVASRHVARAILEDRKGQTVGGYESRRISFEIMKIDT